jgi:hypothetical protein
VEIFKLFLGTRNLVPTSENSENSENYSNPHDFEKMEQN